MKSSTINLLEDYIGYLNDCGIRNDFLHRMKSTNHKDKNDKLDYIKIKDFIKVHHKESEHNGGSYL